MSFLKRIHSAVERRCTPRGFITHSRTHRYSHWMEVQNTLISKTMLCARVTPISLIVIEVHLVLLPVLTPHTMHHTPYTTQLTPHTTHTTHHSRTTHHSLTTHHSPLTPPHPTPPHPTPSPHSVHHQHQHHHHPHPLPPPNIPSQVPASLAFPRYGSVPPPPSSRRAGKRQPDRATARDSQPDRETPADIVMAAPTEAVLLDIG